MKPMAKAGGVEALAKAESTMKRAASSKRRKDEVSRRQAAEAEAAALLAERTRAREEEEARLKAEETAALAAMSDEERKKEEARLRDEEAARAKDAKEAQKLVAVAEEAIAQAHRVAAALVKKADGDESVRDDIDAAAVKLRAAAAEVVAAAASRGQDDDKIAADEYDACEAALERVMAAAVAELTGEAVDAPARTTTAAAAAAPADVVVKPPLEAVSDTVTAAKAPTPESAEDLELLAAAMSGNVASLKAAVATLLASERVDARTSEELSTNVASIADREKVLASMCRRGDAAGAASAQAGIASHLRDTQSLVRRAVMSAQLAEARARADRMKAMLATIEDEE